MAQRKNPNNRRAYKGVYSTKGVTSKKMTKKEKAKANDLFGDLNQLGDSSTDIPICLGRPRAFDSPAELWGAFLLYFDWNQKHPWYKLEYKGKKWHKVPLGRPLSIEGFCIRLGVSTSFIRNFIDNLKTADPQYQGFSTVIAKIKEACRQQKLEGAYVGVFNASIAALDLGMKKDNDGATGTGGLHIETTNEKDSSLLEDVKKMLSDIDEQHNNQLPE
jgi:hypothetical protein